MLFMEAVLTVQPSTLQAEEWVGGRLEGLAALSSSESGHRRSLCLAEDQQTAPPGQGDASSQNKSGRMPAESRDDGKCSVTIASGQGQGGE